MRLISDGPDRTRAIASALAEAMTVGDLLVLDGDLGAGKTCFTQGLGTGLGVVEAITSPTFTLANRYRGRLVLHHLDAYRLEDENDALDLDLDDLLETGVTVIEWGNRIEGLLPADRFTITFRYPEVAVPDTGDDDPDLRVIEIEGPLGERGINRLLVGWEAP
jgi:tRNA threonylcarbamoyladenosine biosynthesis protein TsaE